MLYETYEEYKRKYHKAQEKYNEIVNELEDLFKMTQPGAVVTDKEIVACMGKHASPFDNYLLVKEKKKTDERLEEAKKILLDRQLLLKLKEEELRLSKDWYDRIYTYYYLDKLSVRQVENRVPYSRAQLYRILRIIKKTIKYETK